MLHSKLLGALWVGSCLLFNLPAASQPTAAPPTIGGCTILPADNIWNTPVDTLPLDPNSARYIASIGAQTGMHPDFGAGLWDGHPIGIPFAVVPAGQPKVAITFTDYGDESDPGPYPIPNSAPIEGGADSDGDRHVLVVDSGDCTLYELYSAYPQRDGSWEAASGAVYPLRSQALRPEGWTSADAAGLPILPGLVRYDEVAAGEINHALRFTVAHSRRAFVWPARHYASSLTGAEYPPMGQRFRLRADFNLTGFAPDVQVILRALQNYGMIVADNGSNWYLSGAPDERWDNDTLVDQLRRVKGSDFEAVDVSTLQLTPDSGQARITINFTPSDWLYLPNINRLSGGTIPTSAAESVRPTRPGQPPHTAGTSITGAPHER